MATASIQGRAPAGPGPPELSIRQRLDAGPGRPADAGALGLMGGAAVKAGCVERVTGHKFCARQLRGRDRRARSSRGTPLIRTAPSMVSWAFDPQT